MNYPNTLYKEHTCKINSLFVQTLNFRFDIPLPGIYLDQFNRNTLFSKTFFKKNFLASEFEFLAYHFLWELFNDTA